MQIEESRRQLTFYEQAAHVPRPRDLAALITSNTSTCRYTCFSVWEFPRHHCLLELPGELRPRVIQTTQQPLSVDRKANSKKVTKQESKFKTNPLS